MFFFVLIIIIFFVLVCSKKAEDGEFIKECNEKIFIINENLESEDEETIKIMYMLISIFSLGFKDIKENIPEMFDTEYNLQISDLNVDFFKIAGTKEHKRNDYFIHELAVLSQEKKKHIYMISKATMRDIITLGKNLNSIFTSAMVFWTLMFCMDLKSSERMKSWTFFQKIRDCISEEEIDEFNNSIHAEGWLRKTFLTKNTLAQTPSIVFFEKDDFGSI